MQNTFKPEARIPRPLTAKEKAVVAARKAQALPKATYTLTDEDNTMLKGIILWVRETRSKVEHITNPVGDEKKLFVSLNHLMAMVKHYHTFGFCGPNHRNAMKAEWEEAKTLRKKVLTNMTRSVNQILKSDGTTMSFRVEAKAKTPEIIQSRNNNGYGKTFDTNNVVVDTKPWAKVEASNTRVLPAKEAKEKKAKGKKSSTKNTSGN